jgi:hypothetical protein
MEEDFPLGERMQIGFESGATEEVIYGRNEPSLVHFHTSSRVEAVMLSLPVTNVGRCAKRWIASSSHRPSS